MKDIDKLDPAHIVRTCSQKHVQSVIEDLVEEVRRKHAEVERLKAALNALRAQEPVAWAHPDGRVVTKSTMDCAGYTIPLVAATQPPALAKRLTDGQIVGLAIGAGIDPDDEDDDGTTVFAIARTIESACATAWGVRLEGDVV